MTKLCVYIPLPSNADEPMAVEYQLHGEQNSDIFRFPRHRETLEDPKLALVLWGLCFRNGKIMCLWYLLHWFQVSWEDGQYNLFYYISWIQTKQSKMSLSIQPNTNEDKTFIFWLSYTH